MPSETVFHRIYKRILAMRGLNEDRKLSLERAKRLRQNADFVAWLEKDVERAKNQILTRLMDPGTKGTDNDMLKSVYYFLEHFKLADIDRAIEKLEKDIDARKTAISKLERQHGIHE